MFSRLSPQRHRLPRTSPGPFFARRGRAARTREGTQTSLQAATTFERADPVSVWLVAAVQFALAHSVERLAVLDVYRVRWQVELIFKSPGRCFNWHTCQGELRQPTRSSSRCYWWLGTCSYPSDSTSLVGLGGYHPNSQNRVGVQSFGEQ